MRNKLHLIILALGLLLVLASFTVYALRVSRTIIPADATQEEISRLTRLYGLDQPPAIQYGAFLLLFLPGMVVLAVYGTRGIRHPDSLLSIVAKLFLLLMLVSNGIIALNDLILAPGTAQPFTLGYWLIMVLVGLALANFFFLLVIWNGPKWGWWGFIITSSIAFIFNLIGGVPVIPTIFGVTAPVVLYFLIRQAWAKMV